MPSKPVSLVDCRDLDSLTQKQQVFFILTFIGGDFCMTKQSIMSLKSIESGWLEMELAPPAKDKVTIKLPSSHCEPLADLLDCLLAIHQRYAENDAFGREEELFYTFWEGDPWQYTWRLSPHTDRMLEIELSFCEDTFAGIHLQEEIKLSTSVNFDLLMQNLYQDLKRLLLEYGFCKYKERWQSRDFPIANFIKLRSILQPEATVPESFVEELAMLQEVLESGE
jgi:hypothetical protein